MADRCDSRELASPPSLVSTLLIARLMMSEMLRLLRRSCCSSYRCELRTSLEPSILRRTRVISICCSSASSTIRLERPSSSPTPFLMTRAPVGTRALGVRGMGDSRRKPGATAREEGKERGEAKQG
eukprot:751389-Hanusia_phi.AAC.3